MGAAGTRLLPVSRTQHHGVLRPHQHRAAAERCRQAAFCSDGQQLQNIVGRRASRAPNGDVGISDFQNRPDRKLLRAPRRPPQAHIGLRRRLLQPRIPEHSRRARSPQPPPVGQRPRRGQQLRAAYRLARLGKLGRRQMERRHRISPESPDNDAGLLVAHPGKRQGHRHRSTPANPHNRARAVRHSGRRDSPVSFLRHGRHRLLPREFLTLVRLQDRRQPHIHR